MGQYQTSCGCHEYRGTAERFFSALSKGVLYASSVTAAGIMRSPSGAMKCRAIIPETAPIGYLGLARHSHLDSGSYSIDRDNGEQGDDADKVAAEIIARSAGARS